MQYLEWNRAIARYFFNPSQSGKQVFLHLDFETLDQIGQAARLGNHLDFLKLFSREELRNSNFSSPVLLTHELYVRWNTLNRFSGEDSDLEPFFLIGLGFLILAWTERPPEESSYYAALRNLLTEKVGWPTSLLPVNLPYEVSQLDNCWKALEHWTQLNHGRNGFFADYRLVSHEHVGRIRYQALVSSKAGEWIKRFFHESGFTPETQVSKNFLRQQFLQWGYPHRKEIPQLIHTLQGSDEERKNSLLDQILERLEDWDGTFLLMEKQNLRGSLIHSGKLLWGLDEYNNPHLRLFAANYEGNPCIRIGNQEEKLTLDQEGWSAPFRIPGHLEENGLTASSCTKNLKICYENSAVRYFAPETEFGIPGTGWVEVGDYSGKQYFRALLPESELPNFLEEVRQKGGTFETSKHWNWSEQSFVIGRGTMPPDPKKKPKPRIHFREATPAFHRKSYFYHHLPRILITHFPKNGRIRILNRENQPSPLLQCTPVTERDGYFYLETSRDFNSKTDTGAWKVELWVNEKCITSKDLILEPGLELFPINHEKLWRKDQWGIVRTGGFFQHQSIPALSQRISIQQIRTFGDLESQPPTLEKSMNFGPLPELMIPGKNWRTFARAEVEKLLESHKGPQEKWEVRQFLNEMQALGFFQVNPEKRTLQLSPPTMLLLPDDGKLVRATLTGTFNASLIRTVLNYCSNTAHQIRLKVLSEENSWVPDRLLLSARRLEHLEKLHQFLQTRFPNCVSFEPDTCFGLSLLESFAPVLELVEALKENAERSFIHKPGSKFFLPDQFKFGEPAPNSHPLLERYENSITGKYHFYFWDHADFGMECEGRWLIPHLLWKQAPSIPTLFRSRLHKNTLWVPFGVRFPDALEMALVSLSGELPQKHSKPKHPYFPESTPEPLRGFRSYAGVTPKIQTRINQILTGETSLLPFLNLNQTQKS